MKLEELHQSNDEIANLIALKVNSTENLDIEKCLFLTLETSNKLTELRSYDEWKDVGRQVMLGQHGLWFYDDSSPYKNRKIYVFDVKQTKGHYRKPTDINYNEFFTAVFELDKIFKDQGLTSISDRIPAIAKKLNLYIKENNNNERVGETEKRTTAVHGRTDNGNGRVSQTRKRTSVGSQLTFLDGAVGKYQQVWTPSDGISSREQSTEVPPLGINGTSSPDDVGVTGQDRSIYGTTDREPSAPDIGTVVSRELHDVDRISLGNGTDDIHGLHSSVRSGLDESAPEVSENYVLTDDDFIHRTPKERFKDNVTAIKIVKELQLESRKATPDEQTKLAKYVGWGGLQDAFDENNSSWHSEYTELKTLLSDSEYKSAQETVLNAHFTSKEIIDGIYSGLRRLGVKQGKALEPSCGTGNFIGGVPEDVALKFDGVELDELTASIAKALYPNENIKQCGFEEVKEKDGTYDVVIGNVPFGDYRVYDSDYNRHKFVIHDYFIAKSLDKLRSGGVMAVITGKGTLDKLSKTAREYFAQRAELLGAFRLPNTAFKSNAGTEAVADILFFRKRDENIAVTDLKDNGVDWLDSVTIDDGVAPLNEYFIKHPENVLGKFELVSGRFGQERTVAPTGDLKTQIEKAITTLSENIYNTSVEKEKPTQETQETNVISEEELDRLGVKKFSMFLSEDNRVFIRDIDGVSEIGIKKLQGVLEGKTLERVKGYLQIRDEVVKMIDMQCANCSDEALAIEREKLNTYYDSFIKKFGYIGDKTNSFLFQSDLENPLVLSIEDYREDEKVGYKGALFYQRTIRIPERKTHTDDIFEALAICKNELGEVDLHFIEKITGLSYDDVLKNLSGEIYQAPDVFFEEGADVKYSGWQTKSEYLSGDVVDKIETAKYVIARLGATADFTEEQKAKIREQVTENISALSSVVPARLNASDISVRLGCTWIENRDYAQFLRDILNTYYSPEIMYNKFNGQYAVSISAFVKQTAEAVNIWGTPRMNAVDIFDCAINNRPPTVWDVVRTVDDKEKRVVNKDETALAREKVKEMNAKFKSWLWENPQRREKYEDIYNRKFNSIVVPSFDGSHLQFDGMNAAITLREHQKDAVARISAGKNTLLHHGVGAGKTFEIIAGAMKLKQYGLANKPMIVVPKPLISQWARDVKLLYPNAKVLVATEREFELKNRQKFVAKTATGDWDMVIIGESQFRRIPVSAQRQLDKMRETIDVIRHSIEDYNDRYFGQSRSLTVKKLTATLKKKEAKYKELSDKISKIQDNVIEFEKLGVDALFVDEAHYFKNKEIETSMSNVAGITTGGSERAFDLEMKIDYIRELHGGDKGVFFATGTPISNSMAEMFTMMSYLDKDELQRLGINYFDAWASNFGEVISSLELKTSGKGVKPRMRFARFVNLVELQRLYREFADVKTGEMLHLPVPDAERITVSLPATEQILAYNDEIIARGEKIEAGGVPPEEDNMLKLASDGKKLALDPRCLDENAIDEEDTKVNACIKKVFEIYSRTQLDKSTQVIFCDQSTPKNGQWSVYQDIKDKLIALGVPENEIAFIHDADTDKKKERLFDEMNSGEKRILIGSTQKCGVGANFQKRLIALHHLDVPYRPADMEQREGRIIRQGNENKKVEIYSYITEKTFDSYSYQILENKQRFISQINKGDMTIREANDIDETTLSFAQIKAIATANPDFMRQMQLLQNLKELKMLRSKHYENIEVMKKKMLTTIPEEIARVGAREEQVKKDLAEMSDKPAIVIGGILFNENTAEDGTSYRAKAGDALNVAFKNAKNGDVIGKYGNLDLVAYKSFTLNMPIYKITLKGNAEYFVDFGESGLGNITKIENVYKDIPETAKKLETSRRNLFSQIDEIKKNIDKPFARADELSDAEKELAEIEERLNVNKDETAAYSEDAEKDDRPTTKENDNDNENDFEENER